MRILATADDTGSLKEIICPKGTDTSSQTAPQPEVINTFHEQGLRGRIQKLLLIKHNDQNFIAAARANGQIDFLKHNDTYDLITTATNGLITDSKDKDQFIALVESDGNVITASEQGRITITSIKSILEQKLQIQTTSLKAPLSAFTPHPEQRGIFAFGGKENDIKIVRLYLNDVFRDLNPEILFTGKNVKNDKLDLRVPIWISNILFINLEKHTESSWEFITTTRYGQVRKYDSTHGRKPILDKKLIDKPIVQIAITPNEQEIICTDTHATTALFNTEKGNLIAKYKGAVGAVQGTHSFLKGDKSLIATGGLDRYVRVFNIKSREQVAKVFIGSKISDVLVLDDYHIEVKTADDEDGEKKKKKKARKPKSDDIDDADAIWNELDGMEKKNKKRKVDN